MKTLSLLCCLALPVQAETILSPSEFEAFANGKTLYFSRAGQPYGAEQYLRNRKVIWAFTDGQCAFGEWFAQNDQLCFLYDGRTDAVCWHYVQTDAGKAVRVVGDDPSNDLLVVGHDEEHLQCAAPNVGVKYVP
jgi:hypothetical protein